MSGLCPDCGFDGGHLLRCPRYPVRERPGDDLELTRALETQKPKGKE